MTQPTVTASAEAVEIFHSLYAFLGEDALAGHLDLPQTTIIAIQHGSAILPPTKEPKLFYLRDKFAFALGPSAGGLPGTLDLPSVSSSLPVRSAAVVPPSAPAVTVPPPDGPSPRVPEPVVQASLPSAPLVQPAPLPDASFDDALPSEEEPAARAVRPLGDGLSYDDSEPLLDPVLAAGVVVEEPPARLGSHGPAGVLAARASVPEVDYNGDGVPPVRSAALAPVSVVPSGLSASDERKRQSLRNARAFAVMTQFRLGMNYQDQLAALGLVTQIELALIHSFREAVPDPTKHWDAHRVDEETQRRLARLRWVEREQEREHTGFRGAWNWLMGRGRISGHELYERMSQEADVMMSNLSQGFPSSELDVAIHYSAKDTYV